MSTYSIDSKNARGNTMRLRRIDDDSSESLDYEQSIQTDFYCGLKEDIDKIILKAWDGQ
jgi:hypothetical protein